MRTEISNLFLWIISNGSVSAWWRVQTAGAEGWVPRGNLKIQVDQSSPILSSQEPQDDSNEDARSVASRYSMDSMTAQHPSMQQPPKNRRPRKYGALDQHDQELEEQNLETHEVSLPQENVGFGGGAAADSEEGQEASFSEQQSGGDQLADRPMFKRNKETKQAAQGESRKASTATGKGNEEPSSSKAREGVGERLTADKRRSGEQRRSSDSYHSSEAAHYDSRDTQADEKPYSGRPVRPLPEKGLRESLPPDLAESRSFPSAPQALTSLLESQSQQPKRQKIGGEMEIDHISQGDSVEPECDEEDYQIEHATSQEEDEDSDDVRTRASHTRLC